MTKNYPYPTLYARSSTGAIQEWTIIVKDNYFYTIAGQKDGKLTESKPNYCEAKNVGKSNEVNPRDQAHLEAYSKFLKKRKEGYVERIEDIGKDGFFEPMLAKKFLKYEHKIEYPVAIEKKLNGGRGVLRIGKNGLWMYSRKGESFNCISHIVVQTEKLFSQYPDLVLDGEIYNPTLKNNLGKLMSLVSVNRKPEDITPEEHDEAEKLAQFHVYDGFGFDNISQDTIWESRKKALQKLVNGIKYIHYHPYQIAKSRNEVDAALKESASLAEEGIVVKIFGAPYENKRSKYFLKYKNFEDDEFQIEGFTEGSGDWAGCVKTVICKLPKPNKKTGKTTFESNIRGEMPSLRDLWENRHKYIGQMATVEYQELSPYGVPLIPYTQLPFRNYE
jgi:ATP-dependent DNA ligase